MTREQINALSDAFKKWGFEDPTRPLTPDGTIGPAMRAAARVVMHIDSVPKRGDEESRLNNFVKLLRPIFPDSYGRSLEMTFAEIYTAEWPDDPISHHPL